jgi:hypothetical protein
VIVAAAVVSAVALGVFVNLLSDSLSSALAARPYWYLPALAFLVLVGVTAAYVYEGRSGRPEPPEADLDSAATGGTAGPAGSKPKRPQSTPPRIQLGRRAALVALAATGAAAAGLTWRENLVNLVKYRAWAPGWVPVDRREFSGGGAAFSSDGSKILYLSPEADSIAVHEIDTGIEHRFTWEDDSIATFTALDGEGTRLAGDSYGGERSDEDPAIVRIWSLESKELLGEIEIAVGWSPGYLHFNPVRSELLITRAQWTEENEVINELDLWDVDRRQRLATTPLPDSPYRITVSSDGAIVALSTLEKRVHLYDAASLEEIFTVAPPDYADAICFDRDTTVLVTGGDEGGDTEEEEAAITVWDLESRTQIASRSAGPGLEGTAVAMHPGGREVALGTSLSADTTEVVDVLGQREIFVWDLERDAPSNGFEVEAWSVVALRYADEGDALEALVKLDYDLFAWHRWERAR